VATFRITYRVARVTSGTRLVEDVDADHVRAVGRHVELVAYVCLFLSGRELVVRRLPRGAAIVEPLCGQGLGSAESSSAMTSDSMPPTAGGAAAASAR
jgi:hypothetical protein